MRHPQIANLVAVAAALACGPSVQVHTVAAPETDLRALQTFRMMPTPARRVDRPLEADHPMLNNSITNRALRDAIEAALVRRGYAVSDSAPDFEVAFYASVREKLDLSSWDYGYVWRPGWWRGWGVRWGGPALSEYTEGSVLIDLVDARSRELLWRGLGRSVVSDEPQQYLSDLKEAADAILGKLPKATAGR